MRNDYFEEDDFLRLMEDAEPEPHNELLEFGKFIANAREEKKLSQSELAEVSKLSASLICKIENGNLKYPPSEKAISALAEALELDEYLLTVKAGRIPEEIRSMVCWFLEMVETPEKAHEILCLCSAAQLVGAEVIIEGNG